MHHLRLHRLDLGLGTKLNSLTCVINAEGDLEGGRDSGRVIEHNNKVMGTGVVFTVERSL